jgi:hypothetical protein
MISFNLHNPMSQFPLSMSYMDEQLQPIIVPTDRAHISERSAPTPGGASCQTNAHSPRRRKRIQLSCINCRQKKVKCDRADPCSRCVRLGVICVSSPPSGSPRGRNGGRRKVNHELLDRIAKLENLVEGIEGRSTGESTGVTGLANENRAV